jgi:hypothetical protein
MEFATHIGIFPFILGVFVDIDLLNKEVSRMGDKPYKSTSNAVAFCMQMVNKNSNEIAIFVYVNLDKHDDDVALLSTVVHECVHVKQKVMKHIGEKKVGIETEAYFIDSVFNYVFREITRLKEDKIKLLENSGTPHEPVS